jgi:hypothetical protein
VTTVPPTLRSATMAAATLMQHDDSAPNTMCSMMVATATPNMVLHASDLLGLYVLVD